jgi:hypothetical protein
MPVEIIISPQVVAALVTSCFGFLGILVGHLVSIRFTREQIRQKTNELEQQAQLKAKELEQDAQLKALELKQKAQELEKQLELRVQELQFTTIHLRDELQAREAAVRQEQLTEILKKRIETYPALYEIISIYGRNWQIEGKPYNQAWVDEFLKALIYNNAKNGAFFSDQIYEWYGNLRNLLETWTKTFSDGHNGTSEELEQLWAVIRGPMKSSGEERHPGLGSFIKDELGSYITAIVSARYRNNGQIRSTNYT